MSLINDELEHLEKYEFAKKIMAKRFDPIRNRILIRQLWFRGT